MIPTTMAATRPEVSAQGTPAPLDQYSLTGKAEVAPTQTYQNMLLGMTGFQSGGRYSKTDPYAQVQRFLGPSGVGYHLPVAALQGDQIWNDSFRQPYVGPLDFDNWGFGQPIETFEMRRQYRELYRKEPSIRSAVDGMTESVAVLDVSVLPQDPRSDFDCQAAEYLDWTVENTLLGWDGLITQTAKPAIIDGYAALEKVLNDQLVTEEQSRQWEGKWQLLHCRPLDTFWIKLQVDQFRNVLNVVNTVRGLQYYNIDKVLLFSHSSLYGNPFGQSSLRACIRAANIIQDAYQLWYLALKMFGLPYLYGQYKNANQKEMMINALAQMRAGGFAVSSTEDDIKILSLAGAANFSAFEQAINKLREDNYLAIRGAYLPFLEGTGSPDSRGNTMVSKVASDAKSELLANQLGRLYTHQLGPWVVHDNFPRGTGYPIVVIGGTNWEETAKTLNVGLTLSKEFGLPLSKHQLYKRGGWSPPDNEADDTVDYNAIQARAQLMQGQVQLQLQAASQQQQLAAQSQAAQLQGAAGGGQNSAGGGGGQPPGPGGGGGGPLPSGGGNPSGGGSDFTVQAEPFSEGAKRTEVSKFAEALDKSDLEELPDEPWDDGTVIKWYKSPFPVLKSRVELPKGKQGKDAPIREVSLNDLQGTQSRVTGQGLDKPDDNSEGLPLVVKSNGVEYIQDGHHRLTKMVISGKTKAKVRYLNLDENGKSASEVTPSQFAALAQSIMAEQGFSSDWTKLDRHPGTGRWHKPGTLTGGAASLSSFQKPSSSSLPKDKFADNTAPTPKPLDTSHFEQSPPIHTQAEFHHTLVHTPEDKNAAGVYADFLQDQGKDAHAEVVRGHGAQDGMGQGTVRLAYHPREVANFVPGQFYVSPETHYLQTPFGSPTRTEHYVALHQLSEAPHTEDPRWRHLFQWQTPIMSGADQAALIQRLVAEGAQRRPQIIHGAGLEHLPEGPAEEFAAPVSGVVKPTKPGVVKPSNTPITATTKTNEEVEESGALGPKSAKPTEPEVKRAGVAPVKRGFFGKVKSVLGKAKNAFDWATGVANEDEDGPKPSARAGTLPNSVPDSKREQERKKALGARNIASRDSRVADNSPTVPLPPPIAKPTSTPTPTSRAQKPVTPGSKSTVTYNPATGSYDYKPVASGSANAPEGNSVIESEMPEQEPLPRANPVNQVPRPVATPVNTTLPPLPKSVTDPKSVVAPVPKPIPKIAQPDPRLPADDTGLPVGNESPAPTNRVPPLGETAKTPPPAQPTPASPNSSVDPAVKARLDRHANAIPQVAQSKTDEIMRRARSTSGKTIDQHLGVPPAKAYELIHEAVSKAIQQAVAKNDGRPVRVPVTANGKTVVFKITPNRGGSKPKQFAADSASGWTGFSVEYAFAEGGADQYTADNLLHQLQQPEHAEHMAGHDDPLSGLRGIAADALDERGRPEEASLLRTPGQHLVISRGRVLPHHMDRYSGLGGGEHFQKTTYDGPIEGEDDHGFTHWFPVHNPNDNSWYWNPGDGEGMHRSDAEKYLPNFEGNLEHTEDMPQDADIFSKMKPSEVAWMKRNATTPEFK